MVLFLCGIFVGLNTVLHCTCFFANVIFGLQVQINDQELKVGTFGGRPWKFSWFSMCFPRDFLVFLVFS